MSEADPIRTEDFVADPHLDEDDQLKSAFVRQVFDAVEAGADRALGTVALKHEGDGVYELTKMAVAPEARGFGIGRLLMDAALDLYRTLDARELFLESSSKLAPALRLYERAGFRHHPAPRAGSHYARADVHMIWEPVLD